MNQSKHLHSVQEKARVPYWDCVKAVAIFLVVFSHVYRHGCTSSTRALENVIVGMNMPIFFIVSGYFAGGLLDCDLGKLVSRMRRIAQPFIVFSVVFAILAAAFKIVPSPLGIPLYALKRVLFSGWFVWVLAECNVIVFGVGRIFRKATARTSVLFTVALILWFVPSIPQGIASLDFLKEMFLFFIFGMLVLKPHLNTILSWRVGFFCLFIFATVIFLEGDIKTNQLGFYWCSRSIASLKPFAFFLVRLALGIVGSLAVLFSIKYLPVRAMRFLATFGATSFGVYLLHQWILDRVADLNIFPLSFLSCLFLSAAIFLFCHLVVLLLRIGWFRAAIWGEEILISKFCAR